MTKLECRNPNGVSLAKAVTIQLDQSRLLDLFAQELRRSPLTYHITDMRAAHFSSCAKICCATTSLPNE